MNEEKKVCPYMSAGQEGYSYCQQDRCALWISVYTIEFPEYRGTIDGCAHAIAPMLNEQKKHWV